MARKRKRPSAEQPAVTADNIRLDGDERNVYAESVDEGHKVDRRTQVIFVLCIVLVVLYFFGLVVPKNLFNPNLHQGGYAAGYSFSWFVDDLASNVNGLVSVFLGHDDAPVAFSSTMVRYLIIAMTGAGLALCGAVYQGSFRNALVSPSTLGVMSGATAGMMLWVVFFVDDEGTNVPWLSTYAGSDDGFWAQLVSNYSLSVISFIGCLLVVGCVLLVMRVGRGGFSSPIMLIITGQIIGGVMGALSNTIRYFYVYSNPYGAKAELLTELQIASFYRNYTWIDLVLVGIPIVITFIVIMKLRRRMQALSLGEGEARALGVDAKRMQVLVVGLCTLLTAILISFCGMVGFVGFLVPHLARRLVGPNFSYLLPAATVLGAVFVLGAYVLLLMTLGSSYETMVGMFISIGGAAVFLVTALRGKGGSRGEFR
ncbi:MAG: iron ABC transporter permease [Eggerthellaceae bacterium]|nr:iron ABC transporter permease [Eggerthellaceae bacterium]